MTPHHRSIERNAAVAHAELRALTDRYQREIERKANFYIRSEAQKRRFLNARQITEGKIK